MVKQVHLIFVFSNTETRLLFCYHDVRHVRPLNAFTCTACIFSMGSFILYVYKIFYKTVFSFPLYAHILKCAYQRVGSISFLENFCVRTKWVTSSETLETTFLQI